MTVRRILMWLQAGAKNTQLIATGIRIAAEHGAELNAVITTPKLARSGHWAVGGMVSGMAAEVETRAERAAVELASAVAQARSTAGITGATITQALAPHLYGEFVAVKGRTSDLVIARATADEETRGQIEALVFAAARPPSCCSRATKKTPATIRSIPTKSHWRGTAAARLRARPSTPCHC